MLQMTRVFWFNNKWSRSLNFIGGNYEEIARKKKDPKLSC